MLVRPMPRPSQAVPNISNQPTMSRVSQEESDIYQASLPQPAQSNQISPIHSEPPHQIRPNVPLRNPFIDIQNIQTEFVLEDGVPVQVRLQVEGGYTKVVNEGTLGFEFLRQTYNEVQEHQDYHHV